MLEYIGIKKIRAKAMTRGDYNTLRGWMVPPDEDGADEGYLVEYMDSPNSNVDGYAGYVSWSPKEVFEKAYYRAMPSYMPNLLRHLAGTMEGTYGS